MKNHLLCFLFLLLGSMTALAQKRVSGNVTGSDGFPLIGVAILEAGTDNGTSSDIDGNYALDVSDGATLNFSYTGFATQSVVVGDQTTLNVVLQEGVALDEVVVTALGIEKDKKALSYSVTELGGENFSQARAMNVIQSLSGKVAGVNVSSTATGAGGSTRVVIRGNSSISGNNQPLYVVDGVPIDNQNLGASGMWGGQDWGDGVSSLNPDDIETYTVLKGNSAAALYGFRASNGVILITTKSGGKRKGIGVEFSSQIRSESIINQLDFQEEYGHGLNGTAPTNQTQALAQGLSSWGGKLDGSSVVQFDGESRPYSAVGSNVDRFYRTGTTFSNTLTLSGGDEKYNFRFSGSALNNKDVVPNSGLDRYNFSLKVGARFSEKLSGTVAVNYINETVNNRARLSDSPGNANYTVFSLPASINVETLKGDPDKLGANEDGTELQFNDNVFVTNPYWGTYQFSNKSVKNRMIGNIQLRYEIYDGLYARGRISMDRYDRRRTNLEPYGTAFKPFGGMDEQTNNFQELNSELILGYDKDLNETIGISLFAGGNRMTNTFETLGGSGNNFSIPFLHTLNNAGNRATIYDIRELGVNSIFGSAEIAFKKAIYVTGTVRNDWFSTLTNLDNTNDNSELYYSAGISAVISDLIDLPSQIDFAKVRLSYAEVGGGAFDPYLLSLNYGVFAQGHTGNPLGGVVNNSIPPIGLVPLTSQEYEFGLDFRVLQNRLGVDFSVYNKKTLNDIISAQVSPTSGFGSKTENVGSIENKGIELMVYGSPVKNKDFRWDVTLNYANNQNKVLRLLTEEIEEGDARESIRLEESRTRNAYIEVVEGLPYSQIMGFEYARDDNGEIMLDDEGLPVRGDLVPMGTGVPPTSFGISNTFTYKNMSLSFLLDSKFGGHIYAATNAYAYNNGLHKNTLEGRESGLGVVAAENVEDYYQRIAFNITEEFVQKADFVKLRELVFSYNLPKSKLGNLPFESVNIGVAGRNLWLIASSVDNIDPESTYTSGNGQGLEMFGVPQTRSFQFNIGVKF
ncbi:MAG: SusC/RagA family TonB-linked outer membrane protein [Saprospiraceae bacterium]